MDNKTTHAAKTEARLIREHNQTAAAAFLITAVTFVAAIVEMVIA